MPTADEILAAAFSGDTITIDVHNRTMNIPSTITNIGVEADKDVYKLNFSMPKMYGDIDLSTFDFHINYLNGNNEPDVYEVKDATVDGDDIKFTWLIGRYAALHPGDVQFSICLKNPNTTDDGTDDQEFNIQPASLTVLKGLETEPGVYDQYPNVIEQLRSKISYLEQLIASGNIGGGGSGTGSGTGSGSGGTEETTYMLYGSWVFNEAVSLPASLISLSGMSANTGSSFNIPITNISSINGSGIVYVIGGSQTTVMDSNGNWTDNGYRYVKFSDSGQEVSEQFRTWFMLNATEYSGSGSGESESYTLYTAGGVGTSIYINGNTSSPLEITGASGECRGVSTFKFATSGVEFYFTSGSPTNAGSEIILVPDDNGWYKLEQNTTVRITSGGSGGGSGDDSGSSDTTVNKYTLYFSGLVSTSVYINDDSSTPVEVTDGVTVLENVYKFKFIFPDAVRYSFAAGAPDDYGESISLTANSSGWYTLTQDTTANLYPPAETTLIGEWKFNDNVDTSKLRTQLVTAKTKTGSSSSDYSVSINRIVVASDGSLAYDIFDASTGAVTYTVVRDSSGVWAGEGFKYISFGDGLTVNTSFLNWFTSNATQVVDSGGEEEDPVVTYSVTNKLTNCTTNKSSIKEVEQGGSYSAKITAKSGYILDSVTVTMGGTDVTALCYSEGSISIGAVAGDIVITAKAIVEVVEPESYTIEAELTNCTSDNSTATVTDGESYTATLTADTYYEITSVTIKMGGSTLSSAYDSATGKITISKVTGNIEITAVATRIQYNVTFELGECTCNKSNGKVDAGTDYTFTITPKSGNKLNTVFVTVGDVTSEKYAGDGLTAMSYTERAAGDITVKVTTIAYYSVENKLNNCTTNNSATTVNEGSTYTSTITAADGYETFPNIKVTMGGTDVTSSAVSGRMIRISPVTGNIVITADGVAKVYYKVSTTLSNCSINDNDATEVSGGGSYNATISTGTHYNISTIKVTMGGTDVTSSYVSSNTINIPEVTGDIVIIATASLKNYSVARNYTTGAVSFTNTATYAKALSKYENTITAESGYKVTSVTVKMGGSTLSSAYDSATGKITINEVTGYIAITVTTEQVCVLSGKWLFNETIPAYSASAATIDSGTISATVQSADGDRVIKGIRINVSPYAACFIIASSGATRPVANADGTWADDLYRNIDFGSEEQTVNAAFYNWFIANASPATGHTVTLVGGYDDGGYGAMYAYSVNGGSKVDMAQDTVVLNNVNTIAIYESSHGYSIDDIYTGTYDEDDYSSLGNAGTTITVTSDMTINVDVSV